MYPTKINVNFQLQILKIPATITQLLSQGRLPKYQFPNWELPKGQVRPSKAPQAAVGAEHFGQDELGGRTPRLEQAGAECCGQDRLEKLSLGQHIWEVDSCHLGKYSWEVATWENTLGTVSLGEMSLGRYLTFLKVPRQYIKEISYFQSQISHTLLPNQNLLKRN